MDAPILRLYGDHWTSISFFLDATSVQSLLCVGSPRLVSLLTRSVRHMALGGYLAYLDYNRIFAAFSRFTAIEKISIEPSMDIIRAKFIRGRLLLPNTLTALSVKATGVAHDFAYDKLNLAILTPHLKHLHLEGGYPGSTIGLKDFLLPSGLQTFNLSLSPKMLLLEKGEIDTLPKGLTSLALTIGLWPEFDKYEWPLSLTALTLENLDGEVRIESLPRTLHEFISRGTIEWVTAYQSPDEGEVCRKEKVHFPWREFFPYLQVFEIYPIAVLDTSNLLRSFIKSDPLDRTSTLKFISSSYWDLPSLRSDTPVTTTFKRLWIPNMFANTVEDQAHLERELQELAPLLATTKFWTYPDLPVAMLKYLPSANSMLLIEDTKETDQLSLGARDIYGSTHKVHLSILPSGVRDLQCGGIITNSADGATKEASTAAIKFPPHLTSLEVTDALSVPLLSILPTTLTSVALYLCQPEEWNLVAERLISLVSLRINLKHWVCPRATKLARIASTYPLKLSIDMGRAMSVKTPEESPFLVEFFGDDLDLVASAAASPLPQSSLTHLTIANGNIFAVHPTIIPRLPAGLKHLNITFDPKAETCPPYPLPADIQHSIDVPRAPGSFIDSPPNYSALLRFLPSGLRSLKFNLDEKTTSNHADLLFADSALGLLPRGLVELHTNAFKSSYAASETDRREHIIKLLPPNLSSFDVSNSLSVLGTMYFKGKNFSNEGDNALYL